MYQILDSAIAGAILCVKPSGRRRLLEADRVEPVVASGLTATSVACVTAGVGTIV